MLWLDTSPQVIDLTLVGDESVISLSNINHTQFAILTPASIIIYNKHPLAPITAYKRSEESISNHGYHEKIRVGNGNQIFVQTSRQFLILFQLTTTTKEIFQVFRSDGAFIQNGLPITQQSTFLQNFIPDSKHSNNKFEELPIYESYITIGKIIKISMGINDFWVKRHSHNLLVSNDQSLQFINYKNYNNESFKLTDLTWYANIPDNELIFITFNEAKNYFVFVNKNSEVWFMIFDTASEEKLFGWKVADLKELNIEMDCHSGINFNPQLELFSFLSKDSKLCLFTIKDFSLEVLNNKTNIKLVKTIELPFKDPDNAPKLFKWSHCGSSFMIINTHTQFWYFYSKFGNLKFNSHEFFDFYSNSKISKENSENWFKSSCGIFLNTDSLILIKDFTLFNFNLSYSSVIIDQTTNNLSNPILNNYNYISATSKNSSKYNLPFQYQNKIAASKDTLQSNTISDSRISMSISESHQVAISTKSKLAVYKSTPVMNKWFDYVNDYLDTLVLKVCFWHKDHLFAVTEKNDGTDELILFNKFSLNKDGIKLNSASIFDDQEKNGEFNSDLICWKGEFGSIICYEICDDTMNSESLHSIRKDDMKKMILVTVDFKLIVLNIELGDTAKVKITKVIHLKTLQQKIKLPSINQIYIIENNIIILLNTGELYLLKSFKNEQDNKNWYDLIEIGTSIEYFNFISQGLTERLLYMFNGEDILIYNLKTLIDEATNDKVKDKVLKPLVINVSGFYPLYITNNNFKTFNLAGLETDLLTRNGYLIVKSKVVNKLILNNIIEYELTKITGDKEINEKIRQIYMTFKAFKNFGYCLELLLFKYLAEEIINLDFLSKLTKLIELSSRSASIYVNCLRKVELQYWNTFFQIIKQTPLGFFDQLLDSGDVELCHNYLIVYLSYKKDFIEEPSTADNKVKDYLDKEDKKLVLKIFEMLKDQSRWDLCFDLSRFIKLLEPSNGILKALLKDLKG